MINPNKTKTLDLKMKDVFMNCISLLTPIVSFIIVFDTLSGNIFIGFLCIWFLVPLFSLCVICKRDISYRIRSIGIYALTGTSLMFAIFIIGATVVKIPLCC